MNSSSTYQLVFLHDFDIFEDTSISKMVFTFNPLRSLSQLLIIPSHNFYNMILFYSILSWGTRTRKMEEVQSERTNKVCHCYAVDIRHKKKIFNQCLDSAISYSLRVFSRYALLILQSNFCMQDRLFLNSLWLERTERIQKLFF